MKPGPKPHPPSYFRKRWPYAIAARKAGWSYKEIARNFTPPVAPQVVHRICKRAGVLL